MTRSTQLGASGVHEPVLLEETLRALRVAPDDVVVDATLGGAGHFSALLAKLGQGGVIVGIDADPEAVGRARAAYAADRRPERPVAHIVEDNFRNLARILERLGLAQANAILFDLGWSAYQLASARGFTFSEPLQPLLMTYGEGGETAADLVNSAPEDELADIIRTYGEERFARAIAASIVAARAAKRLLTVGDLVDAILSGTPAWYHERRIHPATKTFQALRIAVNDEIAALRDGLGAALAALAPAGRLAVISFHSIEDRVAKRAFREAARAGQGFVSPKKPVVPARAEIVRNHRARSAKLRIFTRVGSPALPACAEPSPAAALPEPQRSSFYAYAP